MLNLAMSDPSVALNSGFGGMLSVLNVFYQSVDLQVFWLPPAHNTPWELLLLLSPSLPWGSGELLSSCALGCSHGRD